MSNEELFKFINPLSNDSFSNIKGKDLIKLLSLLQTYMITYRNILNIDNYLTFGLELEFENKDKYKEEFSLDLIHHIYRDWSAKIDVSLVDGGEIISPILTDNEKTWDDIKIICNIIKKYAEIGNHCGGHIHIGANALELKDDPVTLLNFIKLWSIYENVIFRFSYGEYLSHRPNIYNYAKPCRKRFNELLKSNELDLNPLDMVEHMKTETKYYAINFNNIKTYENAIKNTVEFRCPNGTLEPIIWQNNVNLFAKLIIAAKEKHFDEDIINEKIKNNSKDELYDEIYLEKAIEFADIIFNNNLDKINFLRQYSKSFDCSDLEMKRAETFIKN